MKIKSDEYEGIDVNLETSLYEYGLIWAKGLKDHENDYRFIYAVGSDGENYNTFDWADVAIDTDPEKEWDWVEFDKVAKCAGMKKEEFLNQSLPMIIFDLIAYYGRENVFGGCYNPQEIELI